MKTVLIILSFMMVSLAGISQTKSTGTTQKARTVVVDKSSKNLTGLKPGLPAMWNQVVYVNRQNGKRLTEAHMLGLNMGRNGDVIEVTAKGDTAFMILKPGVWERIDSVARLVNRTVQRK